MKTVVNYIILISLTLSNLDGCCREGRLHKERDEGTSGGDGGKTGGNVKCFVQKSTGYSWNEGICNHALQELNRLRRLHQDTPDVTLNQTLNQKAQGWAEKTAATHGGHVYQGTRGVGETISDTGIKVSGKSDLTKDIKDLITNRLNDMYTREKANFEMPKREGYDMWGHYVQMVWKPTVSIGMGVAIAPWSGGGWTFRLVMRYYPKSSPSEKEMAKNVRPTIKR